MPFIPNDIGIWQPWSVEGDEIDGRKSGGQFGACPGFEDWFSRFGDDDGQTAGMGPGRGCLGGVRCQQRVERSGGDNDFDPLKPPLLDTPGELRPAYDFGSGVHLLPHL